MATKRKASFKINKKESVGNEFVKINHQDNVLIVCLAFLFRSLGTSMEGL